MESVTLRIVVDSEERTITERLPRGITCADIEIVSDDLGKATNLALNLTTCINSMLQEITEALVTESAAEPLAAPTLVESESDATED